MESNACLLFSLSQGVGPKTFLKLIKHFGSAKKAWEDLDLETSKNLGIGEKIFEKFDASRKSIDLSSYIKKLEQAKVKVVGYTDVLYPQSLKKLDSSPIVLFCKGNLDLLQVTQTIGIVGARKITAYGRDVTEKLTSELVSNNFCIVSGLAFGVDAIAHKTALENKGNTIAVLGCGVDCVTPQENQSLYEEILDQNGLIISEYRLGLPPSLGSFPARNRIIAALSLGILVTEAAEDSGSLITAEEALKLENPVFAVPGSINSQMSRGTLKLLKHGAHLVTSAQDILSELKIKNSELRIDKKSYEALSLTTEEKMILDLIQSEPLSMDEISKKTKIPIVGLMALVSGLEMKGAAKNKNGELALE